MRHCYLCTKSNKMTEQIQKVIDQILSKSIALHKIALEERDKNGFLNQEIELEYPEITKQDLKDAGKTKDKYTVLFKLIKKEKEGAK